MSVKAILYSEDGQTVVHEMMIPELVNDVWWGGREGTLFRTTKADRYAQTEWFRKPGTMTPFMAKYRKV